MADADDGHKEIPKERPTLWGSAAVRASSLAWAFAVSALVAGWLGAKPLIQYLLYAAAIASGAFYFAREALSELVKERSVGIELLMTIAIIAAAALGQWREAALVACLYSITEALEGFTIQRTRHAIRALMDLVPPKARVLRGSTELEVDVKDVNVGERIVVRPGESIPVDGIVRDGASAIDESPITGESMPVERAVGATVFAGTLNGNGALVIETTKRFEDNTVSKIIDLVESAQRQKGKSQLFVERFGQIYSPVVLLSAIGVALIPWIVGLDAMLWLRRAVSFLVAASPCALAVSTPVTLVAAIGSAARRGVLIKGGSVVEALGRVRAVALDKTGTLTFGRPEVTAVHATNGDEQAVLRLAAAVEHFSEHPLAAAITQAARKRGLSIPPATDFRAITAAGVRGQVEGKWVAVLKPSAAQAEGLVMEDAEATWHLTAQEQGQTVLAVLLDRELFGLISVADTIRPESAELVRSLKAAGVQQVLMLTGDNQGTARAIAARVGIEEFYAGLLPQDKVAQIQALRAKYGDVAMVGDGINDAPALAAATVGIAMGTRGSDAALAAADVALMADDLSKLRYAFELGRRSQRIIVQNITLSAIIVVGLVVGTFAADLSMFSAVLSHEGSEVLIILNGLRAALR